MANIAAREAHLFTIEPSHDQVFVRTHAHGSSPDAVTYLSPEEARQMAIALLTSADEVQEVADAFRQRAANMAAANGTPRSPGFRPGSY